VLNLYSDNISKIKDSASMYAASLIMGYSSLLHYLVTYGYPIPDTTVTKNIQSIIDLFYNPATSANVRSGIIIAISNFLGNTQITCDIKSNSPITSYSLSATILTEPKYNSLVETCINLLKSSMKDDSDPKVARMSAWVLGSLCRPVPQTTSAGTGSNVSNNSTNLFKYLFQILEVATTQQSETNNSKLSQLPSILSCFSELPKLPTMRWEPVILGLMKAEFSNNDIRKECIQFAVSHCKNVNSMLSIIDEWTDPPRLVSFSLPLQQEIIQGNILS
jgi:hypothetical protein